MKCAAKHDERPHYYKKPSLFDVASLQSKSIWVFVRETNFYLHHNFSSCQRGHFGIEGSSGCCCRPPCRLRGPVWHDRERLLFGRTQTWRFKGSSSLMCFRKKGGQGGRVGRGKRTKLSSSLTQQEEDKA